MKFFRSCIFYLLVLSNAISWAQIRHNNNRIQTHFSAEDRSVQHPVAIPDAVKTILLQDDSVQAKLANEKPKQEGFPLAWFSAAEVSLGTKGEKDLIIQATGDLIGANITQFWVLRPESSGWNLVLVASAHDLDVNKNFHGGMRDLRLYSLTASKIHTSFLRFNGHKYVLVHEHVEDIR